MAIAAISSSERAKSKISRFSAKWPLLLLLGITEIPLCTVHRNIICDGVFLYVSDSIYPSNVDGLNLRCAISFGPALIINGQPRIYGAYGWGVQPRTCIAQKQDGTVLFLVIDGRQTDSYGATLKQAQDILLNYGAYNAFNLDGGASSTMVFDGNVVNKPSDIAGERYVPTAFIVK